jgi:hypothetical protein
MLLRCLSHIKYLFSSLGARVICAPSNYFFRADTTPGFPLPNSDILFVLDGILQHGRIISVLSFGQSFVFYNVQSRSGNIVVTNALGMSLKNVWDSLLFGRVLV